MWNQKPTPRGSVPCAWLYSPARQMDVWPLTKPRDGHFKNKIISQLQETLLPWDPKALHQPKLEFCLLSCLPRSHSTINWIKCSQINSCKPIFIFVYLYYKTSHKTAPQFSLPEQLSELDYAMVYPSVTPNHLVSPIIVYSYNTPEPKIIRELWWAGGRSTSYCILCIAILQGYLTYAGTSEVCASLPCSGLHPNTKDPQDSPLLRRAGQGIRREPQLLRGAQTPSLPGWCSLRDAGSEWDTKRGHSPEDTCPFTEK